MHLKYRHTCRVCGNPHLTDVIDLGEQYLQGSFVKEGRPNPSVRKIPTRLVRCDVSKDENGCGLVQMSVTTPPSVLYRSYWYESSISATMRDHLAGIVAQVLAVRGQRPTNRVLEIAMNDGTLLRSYGDEVQKWGVDPSDIASRVEMPNLTVVNDLFPPSKPLLERVPYHPDGLVQQIRFDAITSIAMFYDLEDPVAFCWAIKRHLAPDGLWVMELAYLPATLKQVAYDAIVGEHLCFYSLATLERVFGMAGLRCFRAEENDINGGSIQCYVTHDDYTGFDRPEWTAGLNAIRAAEFDMALDTDAPYDLFKSQVTVQRDALVKLIRGIRATGGRVHVLGASTKGNTLLQFSGLDHTVIECAAERSPAKWGAKTLGTDIPIVSEEQSRAMKPAAYLVLPWHFKREINQREKSTVNDLGVKLIYPLPQIEVVERVD